MDDRIRASDADRDHIAARLREHFAAGRLTPDELDERISAALNAKTHGELRQLMADLPEPAPLSAQLHAGPPLWVAHRRPRILPVLGLLLVAAVVFHGGPWIFFGFFQILLVFWLLARLGGLVFAGRHHHNRDSA